MKNILFIFLAILIASCSTSEDPSPNNNTPPPKILSINIDSSNRISGEAYPISAEISNSDINITSYEWTVSDGSYDIISNNNILWHSPNEGGTYTISLKITDSEGNQSSKSKSISLETAILETFQKIIPANYHSFYSQSKIIFIDSYFYLFSSEAVGSNGSANRLKKIDLNGDVVSTYTFESYENSSSILGMFKTRDDKIILITPDNIIKVNTNGEEDWRYPNTFLTRFIELENGNYFFVGKKLVNASPYGSFAILSSTGQLINDGIINETYEIRSLDDIVEGPESDTFFVLGTSNSVSSPNLVSKVLHINLEGVVLNEYTFPHGVLDYPGRLFLEADGTFTVFFNTLYSFDNKIDRINIDELGNINNQTTYYFNNDYTLGIDFEQLNSNGGYIIGGLMGNNLGNAKSLIFKIDEFGEVVWDIDYGNESYYSDYTSSCLELDNGKILVSGSTITDSGTSNAALKVYLNKYRPDGSI